MTTAPSPDEYGTERTINAVDDLGWDPTGQTHVSKPPGDDGLTIEVPPGTYKVGTRWDYIRQKNWCLRGTGDTPGDVVFKARQGHVGTLFNIRAGRWWLGGFTLDQLDDWETALGMKALGSDWVIDGVHYAGWRPNEHESTVPALNAYVISSGGEGYVSDFYADERVSLTDYPRNALMLFSGAESVGTLYVLDSTMENGGEHAIYASRTTGDVRIERCTFRNNQNTQARISGDGSYCKDSLFVWDAHNNKGEFQAQTGLTFEAGYRGYSGGLVENCEFICTRSTGNSGCLKVDGSHGAVTVRDCSFHVDADDAEPIWVDAPGDSHMIDRKPDTPWPVELDGVTITGGGGWNHKKWHDIQHRAAVRIDGRGGSVMRDSSIQMPNRDGIRLTRGDYSLERVAIDVGGRVVDAVDALVDVITGDSEDDTIMNQYEHELRIQGTGDRTTYEFDVTGSADLVTTGAGAATPPAEEGAPGETVVEHDDGSSTLQGVVKGGADTFAFDGELTDVRITSGPDPTVEVDGTTLDLSQFRDGGEAGTDGSTGDGGTETPSGGVTAEEARTIATEEAQKATRSDEEILALVEDRIAEAIGTVADSLSRLP